MRTWAGTLAFFIATAAQADDPPPPPPIPVVVAPAPVVATRDIPRPFADTAMYIADVKRWPTFFPEILGPNAPAFEAIVTPFAVDANGVGSMRVRSASGNSPTITLTLRPTTAPNHTVLECYVYFVSSPARSASEVQTEEARITMAFLGRASGALEPAPMTFPEPEKPKRYTLHLGIADGIAGGIGLITALISINVAQKDSGSSLALALVWPIAFSLAGPIVHLAHDHPDRAALSFFMRGAGWAFAFGSAAVAGQDVSCSDECRFGWAAAGAFVVLAGMGISIAVDYALLSKEDKKPAPQVTLSGWPVLGGGAGGLVGRF